MTFQVDNFIYFYLALAVIALFLSVFYYVGTSGVSDKKK